MNFQLTEAISREVEIIQQPMFPGRTNFDFLPNDSFELIVSTAWIGEARLCRVLSTGHTIELEEPDCVTAIVPLRGKVVVNFTHNCAAGDVVVLPPGCRKTAVIAPPGGQFEALALLAPRDFLIQSGSAIPTTAVITQRSTVAGDSHLRLGRAVLDFADADRGRSARCLETALSELAEIFSSQSEPCSASLNHVEAAERIMMSDLDEPLSVASIAARLGLSERTLQLAFRRHRGTGPLAVLTAFRLSTARRRLLRAAPGETVSHIAMDSGFSHHGRFSAIYRKRYGERPSETILSSARLRRKVSEIG